MLFSSLEFLYLFLPVSLCVYFICPVRWKNTVLLAFSLIFYASGEPLFVLLMIATILADYAFGRSIGNRISAGEQKKAKKILIAAVIFNLGILAFFKYTTPLLSAIGALMPKNPLRIPGIPLPIGISFYTFQALSYVADVYLGKTAPQKSVIAFGTYVSLFPQLIAGPIVRYSDVDSALVSRIHSVEKVAAGLRLFTVGLAKKVLLANPAGELWNRFCTEDATHATVLGAWLGIILFAFQIYFDFSGYSDMAIGLGKIFGFDFPQNFHYPYVTKSITDFWRRWHITLSSWFREYVYIPLGGNRRGKYKLYRNLFITWLLTGIWHGASLNFALWGLWFFVLIAIEKAFLGKILQKLPPVLSHAYALFFILLGWLIFAADGTAGGLSISGAWRYAGHLFGIGGVPFWNATVRYEFLRNLPLLAVMAIGSTPLPKTFFLRCPERISVHLSNFLALLSLLLSTAYLVNSGYNPFLYFRF